MKRVQFLLMILGISLSAIAQPNINEDGILNAASYVPSGLPNSGIAQGSMFVLFGRDLGPPDLKMADQFPLPTSEGLAGTSVRVNVGGLVTNAIMVYTSAKQVAAILPSKTLIGEGTLTLSYNGLTSAPTRIRVVRSAFGIFSRNQAGTGPAIVQNVNSETDRPLNALIDAARPSQTVILWGTGLGSVSGNEAAGPLPGDLSIETEVLVGNRRAKVIYKGRSGCCAGIDQIVFELPPDAEGCYVPVAVKAGGVVSNFATLSISSNARVCSDPHGFASTDLETLSKSGEIRLGSITISRTNSTVTVPQGTVTFNTDLGSAAFLRYDLAKALATGGSSGGGSDVLQILPIPFGSCLVYTFRGSSLAVEEPIRPDPMDAGPSLNLTGPKGLRRFLRKAYGVYSVEFGGGIPGMPGEGQPEYLDPGRYLLDNGTGGRDVGPFRATLDIGSPFVWSNRDDVAAVRRSQDLAVTWKGADAEKEFVVIMGVSISPSQVGGAFLCSERPNIGAFIIPASVLSSLPASGLEQGIPTALLQVGKLPRAQISKFSAPGLDLGYFSFSAISAKYVTYQ